MRLPNHAPPRTQSFHNLIPVRLDGAPGGPLQGRTVWRGVKDLDHSTLTRAFELDQATYWFDLPSSCRGIGSLSSGNRGTRRIDGFVFYGRHERPVGKITVCIDGEKFRDVDPMSIRDFERLG